VRRILFTTAAFAAAVAVFVAVTLPPRRLTIPTGGDGTVAGILHVHTNRSDGRSSPDEVAAAAARAGLKFLVFTDHGDGTRPTDPPTYRSGVLCLDGVEISTSGGHYAAFDMPAAPYPLAGESRDVVEDVRRLGGFGIVAHPDSPKPELAWSDWSTPFDAIELLNPDTSWRILASDPTWTSRRRLLAALLDYPWRAPEVMADLLQPTAALARWAEAARLRRVVTVAGADAHARLGLRHSDPGDGPELPLPGYESSFKVLSVHVRPERPLTGRADVDAALIARAIRNGHTYTVVDALASPPQFDFTATNERGVVHGGDALGLGGAAVLRVQSNAPAAFTTVVRDGLRTLARVRDAQDLTVHGPAAPGVYWAEIVDENRTPPIVWIRSNPVYIRSSADPPPPAPPATVPTGSRLLFDGRSTDGWALEHDRVSVAAFEITSAGSTPELRYRFGLADGPPSGQYTSLVYSLPAGAGEFDRVAFSIRAERPMRISVQIRDTTADRWQRSVYVDASPRERTVRFDDIRPVGVTHAVRPRPDEYRSLMFVVDTTNTRPGTSGRIWLKDVRLERHLTS
jgi:hypothetical protein